MDKEIYDFLNDMDINLDRYEKEELSELEKEKYKKDISKRINKKKGKISSWKKRILVVAASLIILFGFSKTEIGKDTYAMASEVFTNIKYGIKEGLGFVDDIDQYSSKIGLVSESEGIKMKLNDVIVDRDIIYFTLLVDIKEHIPKEYLENEDLAFLLSVMGNGHGDYNITMNNRGVEVFGSKTNIGLPNIKGFDNGWIKEIDYKESRDKGIFDIVIEAENPLEYNIDELEDIDFKLVFNSLRIEVYEPKVVVGNENPEIKTIEEFYGKWKFEFTKDGEELAMDTIRYELDKSIILNDFDLEFIELTSNPLGNKIEVKIKDKDFYEEGVRTNILLDGYDNLGQRRSFSFSLNEGENTIMMKERYNHIDYPQNREYGGSRYEEANVGFKDIEYIEFTPYYDKIRLGDRRFSGDPLLNHTKLGEPFKLYLNK